MNRLRNSHRDPYTDHGVIDVDARANRSCGWNVMVEW